jgi:hypothetical protein
MKEPSRRPFETLPEEIRHHPSFVTWRLDHHEDRLDQLEDAPQMGSVKTSIGQLPWPVALVLLGALAWWRPDLVVKLLGL